MDYRDLIGTKYKSGGRSREEGFDCWGVAIEVLGRNGITLDDYRVTHCADSVPARRIDFAENMCIVEMSWHGAPNHIAVYIGDGLIIHSRPDFGVRIEPMVNYSGKIRGFYSVH